jgi:tetratricopeptide (TPR) repeat protein
MSNAALGYVAYLQKAFWPARLAVVYPLPPHRPEWQVAGAAVLLAALTLGAVLAWRRRYWLVGWFWFLGMLVPMIGLVQVGDQAIADRYTYLPLVGLFLALTWGLCELWPRRAWRTFALGVGMLAVLGSCAALTWRQLALWQNTETLTRHAIAVTKNNYVAYDNLGAYYWEHGRTAEAIESYRQSLAIITRVEPLNNLGLALASQGDYTNAIANYELALRTAPDEVGLRLNLADALAATGRTADTIVQYQAVLRLQPDLPGVRNNLALAFTQAGRLDAAIAQYQIVILAHPTDLQTHNNLGIALTTQGKLDAAVAQFQQVLRLDTNYANAYVNLGNALVGQNKFPEALEQFRHYVRLQPTDVRGHQGLGRGLLELGHLDDALIELNTVVRLQPDNPEAHYYYGLALQRLDRRPEALAQFQQALRLQPDYAEARRQLDSLAPPANP